MRRQKKPCTQTIYEPSSNHPIHIPNELGSPYFRDSQNHFSINCQVHIPIASGEDLKVWKLHLLDMYKAKYGNDFKFYHCYEFAQTTPMFLSLFGTEGHSSKSSPGPDNANKNPREGVGVSEKHSVGTKKVKQIKKEDVMAERMAESQRGLASTAAPTPKKIQQ